jgi:hypothetical protein
MDLHAVHEIGIEHAPEDLAYVRVVVTQARKAFARMKVQISATGEVI